MSRHLFLFFSLALSVAATVLYGGVRPREINRVMASELRADLKSLQDDLRIVHLATGELRSDFLMLWLDARANAALLEADAHFEARQLARPFQTGPSY